MRWPTRDRSAPRRGWSGRSARSFPSSIIATGQRWQLDLGDGKLPLWVFDEARARPRYQAARLSAVGAADLGRRRANWSATPFPANGTLYQRLVQPLLLAALNVDPPEGSGGLAGAIVRETLLAGGQACRPLIARDGLSAVLVEPAIKLLQEQGRLDPARP